MSCPDCTSSSDGASKFCAAIEKESGGQKFNACIAINGDNVARTFGGELMTAAKICKERTSTDSGNTWTPSTGHSAMSPMKNCSTKNDCGAEQTSGQNRRETDCSTSTQTGKCNATHDCG